MKIDPKIDWVLYYHGQIVVAIFSIVLLVFRDPLRSLVCCVRERSGLWGQEALALRQALREKMQLLEEQQSCENVQRFSEGHSQPHSQNDCTCRP